MWVIIIIFIYQVRSQQQAVHAQKATIAQRARPTHWPARRGPTTTARDAGNVTNVPLDISAQKTSQVTRPITARSATIVRMVPGIMTSSRVRWEHSGTRPAECRRRIVSLVHVENTVVILAWRILRENAAQVTLIGQLFGALHNVKHK